MKKVITVNLNGNAYQVDETGFETLRAYLDDAEARLRENPDRAEITLDLEQAIAEKCQRYLGAHKNVVTTEEMAQIVKEMGPVNGGDKSGSTTQANGPSPGATAAQPAAAPKRLYQIREGALISGVCNGLAAYFNLDVSIIRVLFVVLALGTTGAWILVYVVMMFVIPYAETSEERAAAHGLPFNAQQLVERAKRQYHEFRSGRMQRRAWRRRHRELRRAQRREWRHATQYDWEDAAPPQQAPLYATQVLAGFMVPIFGILRAALFVAGALAFISLVTTGLVFGWPLPSGIPLWAGLLILMLVYAAIAGPIRFASRASYSAMTGYRYGWFAAGDGLLWLGFTVVFFWIAYHYVPGVQAMLQSLPNFWTDLQAVWKS
jgi:phage shock protein PspC (stress-responsive transcriptional regulator)